MPPPRPKPRPAVVSDYWRRIWDEADSPIETPVELYLASRGLKLPPLARDVIRFHPTCPFGRDAEGRTIRTPAMIALVRNVISSKPQAVHRTALDATGRKIEIAGCDRMALGPIEGAAVKLTADEDVTFGLGIAEGIETALSLQRLPEWAGSPVWSLLHRHGVETFPLLARVETLAIAVDHDPPGEAAARAVTKRWHEAGREVLLFEANKSGADLNDVIRK
jgi:putative DNA primase/helicase